MSSLKIVPEYEIERNFDSVWIQGREGTLARFSLDAVEVWGYEPRSERVSSREKLHWEHGYKLWRRFVDDVFDVFGIPIDDSIAPNWIFGPKYYGREIQDWPRNVAREKGRERLRELVSHYEDHPDAVPLAPILAAAGRAYLANS